MSTSGHLKYFLNLFYEIHANSFPSRFFTALKILNEEKSRGVIKIIYSEKAFIDKYQLGYDMQKLVG